MVGVLPELSDALEDFLESELRREAELLLLEVSDQRELEREPLRPFLHLLPFLCFLSLLRPREGCAGAALETDKFRLNLD